MRAEFLMGLALAGGDFHNSNKVAGLLLNNEKQA